MEGARPTDMIWVKDMYDGVDPATLEEPRKAHMNRTLNENPDVLFRVYKQGRLHMLFLRPTRPGVWMSVILQRITTSLSFQMTKRRAVDNIFKITMSGPGDELQRFCDEFEEIRRNMMLDKGAAAQNNPEDDVEELRARIRELELENRTLHGHQEH
ncbi:uncharacterized protein LOC113534652 [Tachysurus ichikawai]